MTVAADDLPGFLCAMVPRDQLSLSNAQFAHSFAYCLKVLLVERARLGVVHLCPAVVGPRDNFSR